MHSHARKLTVRVSNTALAAGGKPNLEPSLGDDSGAHAQRQAGASRYQPNPGLAHCTDPVFSPSERRGAIPEVARAPRLAASRLFSTLAWKGSWQRQSSRYVKRGDLCRRAIGQPPLLSSLLLIRLSFFGPRRRQPRKCNLPTAAAASKPSSPG